MQVKRHFLDSFFYPSSIAVIGASNNSSTLNYHFVHNLIEVGYKGKLYPVHPHEKQILGIKAYPSIREIEGEIELVVASLPAIKILDVIKDCAAKKIKALVIIAGGFSEIGVEGVRIQKEMAAILKQNGIRAIGPNTNSPICPSNNMAISFFPLKRLLKGNVAFIFQSGMYDFRLNWLFNTFHLGISKLIDLGNKMDINEVDVLNYLAKDSDTKVIAMHMEGIRGNSNDLVKVLKSTAKHKPVIILRTGRTSAGARAAASHTGSIVKENDAVFDSMLKQCGVIRAQNLEELFDFAKAFSFLPLPEGNRCAIGVFSGGEGVIASDVCSQEGLVVTQPEINTINKIKTMFPQWDIPVNPLDLGVCYQFHPGNIHNVYIKNIATDPNVDCLVFQLADIPSLYKDPGYIRTFTAVKEMGKCIVVWPMNTDENMARVIDTLESYQVPVFESAPRAIKAFGAVYRYMRMRERHY